MEADQIPDGSLKSCKDVNEESFTPDVEDDMYLVQKRYHLVGETPCQLKIGDALCGYLYKTIDDFNNHIKTFHSNEGHLHLTAQNQDLATENSELSDSGKTKAPLFESPETSPSEKRTFDFEQHKSTTNSHYESNRTKDNDKKPRYTISTPPLTPLEKESGYNQEERLSFRPSSQTLYVDVETEPVQNYVINETSPMDQKSRQLLQVAKFNSIPDLLTHHSNEQKTSVTDHSLKMHSSSVPQNSVNLSEQPINDSTSIMPPPPYYGPSTTAYKIDNKLISNTITEPYLPYNINSSFANNDQFHKDFSKDGLQVFQNCGSADNDYNLTNYKTIQSNHLSTLPVSKHESNYLSFNNYREIPQPINHSYQVPASLHKGYHMFGQAGYNQAIQMSQETPSYINNPSQPISSIVNASEHLHSLQKLQHMQQLPSQQSSDWRLLSQQYPTSYVNNPNPQMHLPQTNPINILDSSTSSLQCIPPMMYSNYVPGHVSSSNWQNSLEIKFQQHNKMVPETLHPLNPLIQQVQAIVNKQPRKVPRFSTIPPSNSMFGVSNIGQAHKLQDTFEKHKCSTTSDHKCLIANCCGQGKRGGKRKRVQEKENLNSQQLEEMRNMEWEKREGYKCKVCDIRFLNQQLLIDHLSENVCKRSIDDKKM